jgi:hypothetical protein
VVQADAIGPAGQVEAPPRLDTRAHGEHEQRIVAGVGHVAPGGRRAAVQARDMRGAHAGGRAAQHPSVGAAQLEFARAAEQDHAAAAAQRGDLAGRAGGGWKLRVRRRTAAGEHRRDDTNRNTPA